MPTPAAATTFNGWSVWTSHIDPPRKQVVAIVPTCSGTRGKHIVSPDDSHSGDIERKAALIAAAPALLAALKEFARCGLANNEDKTLIARAEGRTS